MPSGNAVVLSGILWVGTRAEPAGSCAASLPSSETTRPTAGTASPTRTRPFWAALTGALCGFALMLPTHAPRPRHSAVTPTCGWHRPDGIGALDGGVWACLA